MIEYWTPAIVSDQDRRRGPLLAPLWWMLAGVTFLGLIGGAFAFAFGSGSVGAVNAAVLIGLLTVTSNALRNTRRRQVRSLLGYAYQAIRLGLPLPEMLGAAADGETDANARRLKRMRGEMESGRSLAESLSAASRYTPLRTLELLDAAERTGTLPGTLKRILEENDADDKRGMWSDFGLLRSYLLTVLILSGILLWVISKFVLPKYSSSYSGLHISNSATTIYMFKWGQWIGTTLTVVGICLTVVWVGRAFRQLASRALPRNYPFQAQRDQIAWRLPIVGPLIQNRELSDVCAAIGDSLEIAEPLNHAVQQATFAHLSTVLRRRLQRFSSGLSDGAAVDDAAREAKLPALMIGLLGSASRAGDLPAALRFLSRHYHSRFSKSLELLHASFAPLIALIGGAAVLAVWSAVYGPMLLLLEATRIRSRMW